MTSQRPAFIPEDVRRERRARADKLAVRYRRRLQKLRGTDAAARTDETVRTALNTLYEGQRRPPVLSIAKRLNAARSCMRHTITGLQRLLNVDGYSVLRPSADSEFVEPEITPLIKRFGLKP